MNDVKTNTVDFSAKQSVGLSTSLSKSDSGKQAQTLDRSGNEAGIASVKARKQSEEVKTEDSRQQVKEAVTRLNDYVQTVQRNLQFKLDDDSGKTIITVVDKNTLEVVRQIPDDVALRLARDLQQEEPLSLFNAKV